LAIRRAQLGAQRLRGDGGGAWLSSGAAPSGRCSWVWVCRRRSASSSAWGRGQGGPPGPDRSAALRV